MLLCTRIVVYHHHTHKIASTFITFFSNHPKHVRHKIQSSPVNYFFRHFHSDWVPLNLSAIFFDTQKRNTYFNVHIQQYIRCTIRSERYALPSNRKFMKTFPNGNQWEKSIKSEKKKNWKENPLSTVWCINIGIFFLSYR